MLAAVLVALGFVAIVVGPWLPGFEEVGLKRTVLGFVLVAWGLTLGFYRAKSYRGGLPTIVGMLLFGIGIWNGVGDFVWRNYLTEKDLVANVLASVFLIGAGIALLWHGHTIHKSKRER